MGSTVTTGRQAAAFRASSGAVIYCLYEQTYEKNCYPHAPRWSAIHIGTIAGALQKVFDFASSCEGGMLQNPSGWMTPEGYLRSWMTELRSPVRMTRDHSVTLYADDDNLRAPVSSQSLPAVAATLAAAGMPEAANRLRTGEKTDLSLFDHAELVSQLHEEHRITAWRLLADYTRPAADSGRDPSLGLVAAKSKPEVPSYPPALVVSNNGDFILRENDGTWRCHGRRYEIMASYIQSLAATEQTCPGSCQRLIRSYRDHLKGAPAANPAALLVRTDQRLAKSKWEAERIAEAAALPGAAREGDVVTIPFSAEHEYALCNLPRAATTWRVLEGCPKSAKTGNVGT